MTKMEFLDYLEKRLRVLNEKERKDILGEYAQHIELKMESGLSEDAAIHDFGNLEELTAEILEAYNVNPDYCKKTVHIDGRKFGEEVTSCASKAGKGIGALWGRGRDAVGRVFSLQFFKRFKPVFMGCVIVAILVLVYLPLAGIAFWFAERMYSNFGYPFDTLVSVIFLLLFHICFLLLSFSALYSYISRNKDKNTESGKAEVVRVFKSMFRLPRFTAIEHTKVEKRRGNILSGVKKLIKLAVLVSLKCMAVCILTPVLIFQFFGIVAFGGLVVLVVLGYPLIGLTIAAAGGLISGFSILWLIGSFIFPKRVGNEG